jgi:hypothetical protein
MAFTFRLEQADGTPADPPVLHTATPVWNIEDTIPLGSAASTRAENRGRGARAKARALPCSPA